MSDIKKLLEHIDEINASTSSKKQLSEAGWTPNEAQRKWLGGADINDPFIIARMPARLGPKPGIPDLPPADQEIAKQYNRGVDNANRIRSFFGLKTGANQPATSANQPTTILPAKSSSPTTDTQLQPGTTRSGLRMPFQLPDGKVDIVPSEVKTQTGIRQQAVPIELNEIEMDESGLQAYLGNKKYGKEGMDALRKAGRDGASKEKMAKIRAKYDKLDEEGVAEAGYQSPHAKLAQLKAKYNQMLKSPNPNLTTLRRIRDEIIKLEFDLGIKEGVAKGSVSGLDIYLDPKDKLKPKKYPKKPVTGLDIYLDPKDKLKPKKYPDREQGVTEGSDENFGVGSGAISSSIPLNKNGKTIGELFQTREGSWGYFVYANAKSQEGFGSKEEALAAMKRAIGQGVTEGKTQRSTADRLTRKFENYLSNRFEMLEGSYGSEKKNLK